MPVEEELYVLAPGEGEGDTEGWVSPQPIDEGVAAAVAAETDLAAGDLDDLDEYVDPDDLEALLAGESDDESLSFTVEGHEVVVEASGHVRVDEE
jgi:hypothetical protein